MNFECLLLTGTCVKPICLTEDSFVKFPRNMRTDHYYLSGYLGVLLPVTWQIYERPPVIQFSVTRIHSVKQTREI